MTAFRSKNNKRKQRRNSNIGYGTLENRRLLCSGSVGAEFGMDGVGRITISGADSCLELGSGPNNSVIVNGNTIANVTNLSDLRIIGTGEAGQRAILGGSFRSLEKLSISQVSEIEIPGDYELSGDFTVNALATTGDLVQDSSATLIVGGQTNIIFGGVAAFFSGNNDFQGPVSATAAGLIIGDANDLLFGNVDVETLFASSIEDTEQVSGTSIETNDISRLQVFGNVELSNRDNDFDRLEVVGNNFKLTDRNSIELSVITTVGSVEVNAGGDITIPVENEYQFTNSLANSNPNGIALQAIGNIAINNNGNEGNYEFVRESGLVFDSGSLQENYFIELDVIFGEDEIPLQHNKLLDFKNRTSDNGLYLFGDQLRFYNETGAAEKRIVPGQLHTIGIQRTQGIVTTYIDGEKQFAFIDDENLATYELLNIFLDDFTTGTNDAIPGIADELRITQREFHVGSDLKLDAAGDIDLSGAIVSVPGNLSIRANDVKIVGTGDLRIQDAFVRGDSEISTIGRIFQTGPSAQFTGNSIFNASGNINLSRTANNFVGTVSAVGENVVLADRNNIRLGSVKANTTISVTAESFVSNTENATVLARQGIFSAGEIRLGNRVGDDVRFGLVNLTSEGRTVLNADSSIRIQGLSASSSLVSSTGSIFDAPTANIDVEFNAKFVAPTSISLGDTTTDSLTTGQVTLQSDGYVGFNENGDARFVGRSFGRFINVAADGELSDTDDAAIDARNGIRIEAGSATLGDASTNNFQAQATTLQIRGDAYIGQVNNILLTGDSVVDGDLTLSSNAEILDTLSSFLTVLGHLHVEGNRIFIGDSLTSHLSATSFSFDSNTSATVLFSGKTLFGGSSRANDAFVFANGTLGSLAGTSLDVSGRMRLEATSIKIGDKENDNFRSTQIEFTSNGRVDLEFDKGVVIAGNSNAQSLRVLTNQFISDASDSQLLVEGHSRFIARNVTIGERTTDRFETASLSFVAQGTVSIREDNNMRLWGSSEANRVTLRSSGSITDSSNAEIIIEESARLSGTNLIIGDLDSDCFFIATGQSGLTTVGNNIDVTLGC